MVIEYFLEWVETAPVNKRAEAAAALVRAFLRPELSEEEREDVEAAITTLLEDTAPTVRLALAEAFGAFASAPRHIISTLGQDNIDISIVVLSRSPVFHDAELVRYAQKGQEKQQIAIACRPWLSAKVVEAIGEHSCRDACYAVLVNPAAEFTQSCLHTIASRYGADTEIRNLLTDREDLPPESRLLLVEQLGSQLANMVEGRNWVTESRAEAAVFDACERASIIFAAKSDEEDVKRIVRAKINEGRLTVAYLLRAVCMGNITLVAHAFAELSGVKFARVETVLTKDRRSAFRAIYDRAGLPSAAFIVFQTAISTWRDLLKSKSEINQARLPFLVTREVLSVYSGEQVEMIDELLVLLRKLSAEAARESSKSKAVEIASRQADQLAIEDATVSEPEQDQLVLEDADLVELEQGLAEEAIILDDGQEVEEVEEVEFPHTASNDDVAKVPVIVDPGHLGDLGDDDFDEMYADIYGLADRKTLGGEYSQAA